MDLCELLQSVPHLSNIISRRGNLGLLQSVSRQLCSWVHSYCTQLRLNALIPDECWLGLSPEEHYRILAAWFWPNLQSLSIQVGPFDADLIRLLSQGQWPVLQQLYIQFATFDSDCLRLISKATPNLCQLTLKGCHLAWHSADVTQLMQGEWSQLQRLRLSQHRLTGVVQQLSAWPVRQHITELDLSDNGLKATDMQG